MKNKKPTKNSKSKKQQPSLFSKGIQKVKQLWGSLFVKKQKLQTVKEEIEEHNWWEWSR